MRRTPKKYRALTRLNLYLVMLQKLPKSREYWKNTYMAEFIARSYLLKATEIEEQINLLEQIVAQEQPTPQEQQESDYPLVSGDSSDETALSRVVAYGKLLEEFNEDD